jgi:hypothetical protein
MGLLRRHRVLLAAFFSLLFVCTQQEAAGHAITHFKLGATQQQLSNPQPDVPCIECELLAGSSAALVSSAAVVVVVFHDYLAVLCPPIPLTLLRYSYYRSRAPPAFS